LTDTNEELSKEVKSVLNVCGAIAISKDTWDCLDLPTLPFVISGENKVGKIKCHACDNNNFDWCWNCEKPICKHHAYAIKFQQGVLVSVCSNCKNILMKHSVIKIEEKDDR